MYIVVYGQLNFLKRNHDTNSRFEIYSTKKFNLLYDLIETEHFCNFEIIISKYELCFS